VLKISPTKLGIILSACSPEKGGGMRDSKHVEYRNYDSTFWDSDMFDVQSKYVNRHSHELYYEYLVNPELLGPLECFSNPSGTSERIKYTKKGITGRSSREIVSMLNEPGTYPYCSTSFWTYAQAKKDLNYICKEDIENLHIVRTDRQLENQTRRPTSVVNMLDSLKKISTCLPSKVVPPLGTYYVPISLEISLYAKHRADLFNSMCLAGSDGTLLWKSTYSDNYKQKIFIAEPCMYFILTPSLDIYVVLRESSKRYTRIIEEEFYPPGTVNKAILWSILYGMLEYDGTVFDFVPGLMLPQIESIISEALLMGIKSDPADLEHEEDGSITDLVTSIARKVKLVTYPEELDRLRD
jgi:hypothetical protein